jgi:hypothetical protein
MAKKYITNTENVVDWDEIISLLNKSEGSIYGDLTKSDDYFYPTTLERVDDTKNPLEYDYLRDPNHEINKVYGNNPSAEFVTFTRENSYGKDLDQKIGDLLGCKIFLSWISKVEPGKCAAPHVDDEEIYFANSQHPKEKLARYHIHVSKPSMGAAFFIGEDCYYYEAQGSVFQWPAIDSLHCGMNASIKPKFLYHAIGVINE